MQTSASKAQRIAELEAELAELTRPTLLRVEGKHKTVTNKTVLSDPQTVVTFTAKGTRRVHYSKTKNVLVIEYED